MLIDILIWDYCFKMKYKNCELFLKQNVIYNEYNMVLKYYYNTFVGFTIYIYINLNIIEL